MTQQTPEEQNKCVYCEKPGEGTSYIIKGIKNYIGLYPQSRGALDLIAASVAPYKHTSNLVALLFSPEGYAEHFKMVSLVTKTVREVFGAKGLKARMMLEIINSSKEQPLFHLHTVIQALSESSEVAAGTENCPLCNPPAGDLIQRFDKEFTMMGGGAPEDEDYGPHMILAPQRHIQYLEQCDASFFSHLAICMQTQGQMFSAPYIDIRMHENEEAKKGHFHAHIHNRWEWTYPGPRKKEKLPSEELEYLDQVGKKLSEALR